MSAARDGVAFAPGRVNLIGEHTDYNGGFVLPIALGTGVRVAFRARDDGALRATSTLFAESREARLTDLDAARGSGWFAYVAGVAWALQESGVPLRGADLTIESELPGGAGLSSSAALEVATALALTSVADVNLAPAEIARISRRAENEFVGVACGVMDQMASAMSRAGHAMLLDCRSLAVEFVPIPPGIAIAVIDSGARRSLASTEYNARRAACERVARTLGVRALRDVTPAQLRSAEPQLDPADYKRALHVVAENARVLDAVAALRAGDGPALGALLNASHASLRDRYEVSGPELDATVRDAMKTDGCHGARMTGAGFGGHVVAVGTPAWARAAGYRAVAGGDGARVSVSR